MSCPYAEPSCPRELPADAAACPACHRFVKTCRACAASNRAFANFCRACAEPFGDGEGNWLGFKGGARRLGSHGSPRHSSRRVETADTDVDLRLGSVCRALLGYDRHLIAVAQSGAIEIVDPRSPASSRRFQAHGPVTAEPCVERGVLYVGSRDRIAAYSLGALTLAEPRVRPLWEVPLAGAPIHALTPLGNALYLTVVTAGRKEVQVIDDNHGQPSAARPIHAAPRVSWIAADAAREAAVFLSEDERGVHIHLVRGARAQPLAHPVPLGSFSEHPIVFLGGDVFAVFDDARLYRLDPESGAVGEALDDDTQFFSLTDDADGEWDRDGVRIDSGGIHFGRAGVHDAFSHLDRAVKGSPVIAGRRAAAVGMEDGRVLVYDLQRLPRHDSWRIDGAAGAPIAALAAFDTFIAAGNRDGVVRVREIRAAAEAS